MNTEEAPIKIEQGTPVILLTGTNKLTGDGGIFLTNENANIIINGQGSLIIRNPFDDTYGAGIGSNSNCTCGNITILNGTLDIEGNSNAAGIGSGSWLSSCGDITISGGTVTAISKGNWEWAYAIGSGRRSSCRSITLSDCILYLNKDSKGSSYIGASTITPDPNNPNALTAANVKLYKDGVLFNDPNP